MTSLTAERWRLHGGELPAASAVGGQEQGVKSLLPSQRLVLRTVGSTNVEGMDFPAVAALIKDAGGHLHPSFRTELQCYGHTS